MKNRPYIECPLSAALAAKNFGFKFIVPRELMAYDNQYDINNKDMNGFKYNWNDPINYVKLHNVQDIDSSWTDVKWRKMVYFIAPESLPLLNPMVGDLIEFIFAEQPYEIVKEDGNSLRDKHLSFARHKIREGTAIVIQRNNKPFPEIHYENNPD